MTDGRRVVGCLDWIACGPVTPEAGGDATRRGRVWLTTTAALIVHRS